MNKGLLLVDRDGTVIEERNYLSRPEDVVLLPGAAEGLYAFAQAGFRIVMITNQAGVGRGYFTEAQVGKVHQRMSFLLSKQNVALDNIFYCPHHPDDGCDCRKPNTGLAERALSQYSCKPGQLVVIGDKACDIELGSRLKAITVLVRTGYGEEELKAGKISSDLIAENILDAAQRLGINPQ